MGWPIMTKGHFSRVPCQGTAGYHSLSRLVFSTFSSLTNISTHSSCIAFHTELANHAISSSYKLLFTFTLCARMRSKGRVIALSFSMLVSLFVCGCKNVHVERIRNVYSHFIMKTYTYTYLTNKNHTYEDL